MSPTRTVPVVVAALAAVAVGIALVVALTRGSGPSKPASPQRAAEQWAMAVIHNDGARVKQLSCTDSNEAAELRLLLVNVGSARTEDASAMPGGTWNVLIDLIDPDGHTVGLRYPVIVQRDHGTYVVC